jgi:uncharacterized RDD family membrane protein YckC
MPSPDNLTIDTPEQVALELPLAGIGSRFLALAIDSLLQIVAVIALVIILALAESVSAILRPLARVAGPVIMTLFWFCLYWGYFAFFEIFWQGQTPGKRYAGVRVIKETGRPAAPIEAIARNLLRAIDGFPGFYAVGLICMMCNKQNRRLGDYVAGTVVVHDKTIDAVSSSWGSPGNEAAATAQFSTVSADELVLIETYLNRRYELDPGFRLETARKIVSMIRQKTGVEKPPTQSDDDFLEAVVRDTRDVARFR